MKFENSDRFEIYCKNLTTFGLALWKTPRHLVQILRTCENSISIWDKISSYVFNTNLSELRTQHNMPNIAEIGRIRDKLDEMGKKCEEFLETCDKHEKI